MSDGMERFGHIGVLMGGCSSEREISIKSGRAIAKALQELGCSVSAIKIQSTDEKEIISHLKQQAIDIAFIALHGPFGEDGTVQKICENCNIPYTGSDPKASRLAMDKGLTQELFNKNGIMVPPYLVVSREEDVSWREILNPLGGSPVVVKPACEGSSIGITIVQEQDCFTEALDKALQYGQEVLIERYIHGREFTAGILGTEALPLVEIRPQNSFFDFTAKYQKGMTDYIVPADISPSLAERIQKSALQSYHLVGCRDFARCDFILDEKDNPFLLEINTIPGFTATSLLPMAAEQAGVGFGALCLKIMDLCLARKLRINHVS